MSMLSLQYPCNSWDLLIQNNSTYAFDKICIQYHTKLAFSITAFGINLKVKIFALNSLLLICVSKSINQYYKVHSIIPSHTDIQNNKTKVVSRCKNQQLTVFHAAKDFTMHCYFEFIISS